MSNIIYINLADLEYPSFQAHSKILPSDIKELSDSIKSVGVLEPLLVKKIDGAHEIIAGCLRYQAAQLAGLKAVPCIVMQLDGKQAEIIKLHENIKRVPLDHIDQSMTFVMMMEDYNMTEQSISEVTGKSISYISQHISLIKFCDELAAEVKQGNISFSQARELMRVTDKSHRNELLHYCKQDGASVQVIHSWVQDFLRKPVITDSNVIYPVHSDSDTSPPEINRVCEACETNVPISHIRQVFYCPQCHTSIKNAISDEKAKSV